MATNKMEKIGYGQVEPNRLNAQYTKEVYAQLPCDKELMIVENGMALIYDEVEGIVKPVATAGTGKVCLVVNEINNEDDRYPADSDYALFNRKETNHQIAMPAYPKLLGLTVGDTFHTNTVKIEDTYKDKTIPEGTTFIADTDGYWTQSANANANVILKVVKDSTMPDGQRGLKFVVDKVDYNSTTTGA